MKIERDAANHAADEFLMEPGARPLVPRVRQAAYDVLFNKEEWGTLSIERRELLRVAAGISANGEPFVRLGETLLLSVQALDEFRVFPLDQSLAGKDLPTGWWWKRDSLIISKAKFHVI